MDPMDTMNAYSSDGSERLTSNAAVAEDDKDEEQQEPGQGWTNGDLPHSMFPVTRAGRLSLYSSHRRWIGLQTSWTRITKESSEYDHRHSISHSGTQIEECQNKEGEAIRSLIAQLCETFYKHGWATGTGGGVSIRTGGPSENRPWRVFVAPSGIQKEDMIGDDVFELDMDRRVVNAPKTPHLKQSACTPLWYVVYRNRPSARCVIHTHSMHAQMATLLDPTETSNTLRITHLEMLKGVGFHSYDDVLEIPIIDNRPSEDLLANQLEQVIQKYPNTNAVLVRRHGVYVWGDSWEQAKTQCESFDYLFQSAVQMKQMGIDPATKPTNTYRVDPRQEEPPISGAVVRAPKRMEEPPHKRKRTAHDAAVDGGFHGKASQSNQSDVASNPVPLLPKDAKILLLDIEGCTTAISFVKETLFPYVLEHIETYTKSLTPQEQLQLQESLSKDLQGLPENHPAVQATSGHNYGTVETAVVELVRALVKNDVKGTNLKAMQGNMWKRGYEEGALKGHVYDDFVPLLEWCKAQHISVHIYSSGSVQAQKLLFGYSDKGDLCKYFDGHFDTTSGSKKEAASYETIASKLGVVPSEICFVSDAEAELDAAYDAGIGHVVMSIRPGNVPLTNKGKLFPAVHSLLQLCGT